MSNWKKLVVSGSAAHLTSVTASNGVIVSGSSTFTGIDTLVLTGSGFVTGSWAVTGSLNMSGSISNPSYIDFQTTSSAATATGRLVWNDGDGTLDLGLKGGTLALQLGQDSFARVYNAETTTLNKGEIVYISGSQGNRISVKRADNDIEAGSANTLGMVSENILSGDEGFVFTSGIVNGLNTVGLTAGATLYLSSSGQYTQIPPVAPKHTVIIGFVERVNAVVGSIFVKINNGYELGELHNVLTNGANYGDLLMYSASLWTHSKQLSGSYGLTGSLQATSFTGSLQGTATTASYVLNAVSSSFATTASYVLGGGGGASVTNPGNNYLITSDGTAGGLVGESNLSFDGSKLVVTGSVTATSFTGSLQYFDFNANTNTSNGIGIGLGATNNYSLGVGIGYNATNNYNYGVGIGQNAFNNYTYGVAIGAGSISNYEAGVAIGYNATNNYNYGVGIGATTTNNYNYGVGVGAYTNTNTKGTGTVTIGAFSKAERQNEFVTTATDNTINKSQSIIQKFRNKTLASSGGIWQEIFTDASSARLTILASSVYHYRIQINAIGATGFLCTTWEITGAIKRDASNNTTMVGGAPTYVITSEDTSTGNWDVRVTADNTNEALEIEVKHDYANNVTFSATIWATETRL